MAQVEKDRRDQASREVFWIMDKSDKKTAATSSLWGFVEGDGEITSILLRHGEYLRLIYEELQDIELQYTREDGSNMRTKLIQVASVEGRFEFIETGEYGERYPHLVGGVIVNGEGERKKVGTFDVIPWLQLPISFSDVLERRMDDGEFEVIEF